MVDTVINTVIQLRRGTEAQWTAVADSFIPNPGEPCLTMDGENKGKLKFGDGTTTWGNLEYSGGTTTTTQFFEGTATGDQTDQEVISSVVGSTPVFSGDVFVVNHTISSDIVSKTAYNYNGSAWVAMDGNYDAENVYLGSDLVITADIGVQTIDSTGSKTLNTTGKNIKQVLDMIVASESNPTITQPSVSVSSSQVKAYEAGSNVTASYTSSFNPGSYQYGPATGVTATGWSVILDTQTLTTQNGTFAQIQVTDSSNLKISSTATYGAGAIPVTNLGNNYAAGQITAGSKSGSTSGSITGFRQIFYGVRTTTSALDSATIRALTNTNNKASARTFTINASAGAKQIVVAIPASSGLSISQVLLTSSMNADITSNYVLQSDQVNVEGANGYTAVPYKVYVYQPASIDPTEVHKVTIS